MTSNVIRPVYVRTALLCVLGGVGGFLSAFVVTFACGVFHVAYGRMAAQDLGVFILYALVVGIMPGALLGLVLTPLAYAIFFRETTNEQLFTSSLIVFAITVLAGSIGAIAQEFFAFTAALVGFFAGVLAAFARIKDTQEKTC